MFRSAIEPLEPRVLLSAALLEAGPGNSVTPTALTHPTMILQGISPNINSPPGTAFTPSQINSAYGFNQVLFGSVAGSGSGQTVAIIDTYDDPTALNDLNQFSLQFGLPQFNVSGGPTFTKVGETGGAVPGTDPAGPGGFTGNDTWEEEESLDIEWVHAIAPQANIILVEASSPTDADLTQTAVPWAASQPGVVAVSMSYSEGEFSGENALDSNFVTPSGHAGVTFFASTGDYGEPAGYPAYSPNVVAVGGTSLALSGSTYQGEAAWSGSGGGISLYESQPSYQNGVVTQSTTNRTAPDVSMDANPNTGVAIYDSYDFPSTPWLQIGGTSLSTPMWAGLMAIVDQGRAIAGLGSLDGATQTLPALYSLPAADLHDITAGSNGYSAGAGYDLVTGRGTPVGNQLIPDLVSTAGPVIGTPAKLGFMTGPSYTQVGQAINPAVTVAVQDASGNTVLTDNSTVTLTLDGGTFAGGGNAVSVAAVNGIATFDNLVIDASGRYTLTADDGSLAEAASQSFTVVGAAAKLVFTQQPGNTPAGTPITPALTVVVQDSSGNTVLTEHSTVTLTLNGGTFAGGSHTVTVAAVNGVATFDDLIIVAPGSYTLTAGDGTLSQDTSQSFTIFYPAVKLGFTRQPTGGLAGTIIAPAVTVAVEDQFGNTVVWDNSTVTLTLSSGTFSNGANSVSVMAVNGVATFTNLIVNAPGKYTLIAGDDALTGATSSSFTVTSLSPTVSSINRESPAGAVATPPSVTYAVTFSEPVAGVTSADFRLAFTGGTSASSTVVVSPSSGYHSVYYVTVTGITGAGTLRLDLADNGSIVDASGHHLADSVSTFQAQQTFAAGIYPTSAALGDLNGDGKADMVVTNYDEQSVSVLLGNGDGTFQNQQTYAGGSGPDAVAVADVNGDGKPDLVVSDFDSNELSVFWGNGDGTFQHPHTFWAGSAGPETVVVMDINGDGVQDLIVANNYSDDVSVLLGNGNGSFQAPKAFATGTYPQSVAVGDVNGDGKLDLVVPNWGDNTVSLLLGNGDGTFQPQRTFATGWYPSFAAVADVNGDGRADLLVTDYGQGDVGVWLGNGDGTFQDPTALAVGNWPTSVAVADLNGDGTPDLAVTNSYDGTVSVLSGNGDGTFQTQEIFATGSFPCILAVADLNGDGLPDLVVPNADDGTVGVLLGVNNSIGQTYTIDQPTRLAFTRQPANTFSGNIINGSGGVQVAVEDSGGATISVDSSVVTLTLSGGVFADGSDTVSTTAVNGVATFNGLVIDAAGHYTLVATDAALAGATSSSFSIVLPPANVLSIHRETPTGGVAEPGSVTYTVTFNEPVTGVTSADFRLVFTGGTTASSTVVASPAGGYSSVYHVTVNNVSGNGTLGLNLVDNGSILDSSGNHLVNSDGTFQAQKTLAAGSWPCSVAAADVNGDGKPDLMGVNYLDNTIYLMLGNGDGTFQPQEELDFVPTPDYIAVADLNGDGCPDLVIASDNGTVNVLLGNGDGTFQDPQAFAVGRIPESVVVADVNDDGHPDLVVANYDSSTVSVLLGNGDGTFQPQSTFATGLSPYSAQVGDVNGDGKLDLVVANEENNNVGVLLGNGDGTFQPQRTFATGSFPQAVGVADLNGDGKLDLAVATSASGGNGSVSVLLGNGDGTFQPQTNFATDRRPDSVAVIDVNGDGRPDLVTTNESANNLSVLLGNGDGTFQAQKTFPTGQYPISLAVADFNGDGAPDLAVSNMDSGTVSILLNHNLFTGQVYTIDPPAQLAFTQPPGSATAGKTINPGTGVQVAVEDSSGTTLGIDSSVVTLTLSGGTFADGGTTESVAAVNGVATFSNLVINAVGDYTLTASDDALTGASSGKFTVCPLGDVIYAGSINSTNGAADIDAVYAHFGDTTGRYDLNGDSAVNQADVNYLVTTILQTGYGDSNLDHAVDFLDFQNLLNHWQATGLGWAGCDFNADGVTDFMDFQVMLNNWNPSGIWNSSEQASATASGSGSIRGAAAPANASQTASASMAVSSTPAADDLPASGGPLVGPVDLLATPANRNASIYVPAAKTTVLFHRAGRANASWTSDNDTVDLLTQLRSKPLPA